MKERMKEKMKEKMKDDRLNSLPLPDLSVQQDPRMLIETSFSRTSYSAS
eukprot:CAMPEP_0172483144 /NCGR_PEP_ID=MMETSP1066-20121228/9991_1 /TAXON_ID=671091 /ORGANISM="Coscinodiscus wailesii, Strain CCMP2513" /LENGTH=48 /DNA_ID= /DNA_START= /DNA_END= /DNA_ORIENTATION=